MSLSVDVEAKLDPPFSLVSIKDADGQTLTRADPPTQAAATSDDPSLSSLHLTFFILRQQSRRANWRPHAHLPPAVSPDAVSMHLTFMTLQEAEPIIALAHRPHADTTLKVESDSVLLRNDERSYLSRFMRFIATVYLGYQKDIAAISPMRLLDKTPVLTADEPPASASAQCVAAHHLLPTNSLKCFVK